MVVETLVDHTISDGKRVVEALKRKRFSFSSAFWYYRPEYNKWTLIIETSLVNEKGPREVYRFLIDLVHELRKRDPGFALDSTHLEVVKRGDPTAQKFHEAARRDMIARETRFTGPTPAGFVEDSYVYWVKELEGGTRRGAREPVH